MMASIKRICALLTSQIKQPSAKLPKNVVLPKIQDNDQSIKLGAINEKHHSNLRSKTRHR
jgi:hypothetical protein